MKKITLNYNGKTQTFIVRYSVENDEALQTKAEDFLEALDIEDFLVHVAQKIIEWVPDYEGDLDKQALVDELCLKRIDFDDESVTLFLITPTTFPEATHVCILSYSYPLAIEDFGMYVLDLEAIIKRDLMEEAINSRDLAQFKAFAAQYNLLPPPWVVLPHAHPISIGWRMGFGEGFIDLWGEWWHAQKWNKAQKIDYFEQFKPPYAWLEWVLFTLWPEVEEDYFDAFEESEDEANETLRPYFERLEGLGFGGFDDWKADFEREGWQ